MREKKFLLEHYKAEAIKYRMYFGKAHESQVDWLRKYIVKNPNYLPEDIIAKKDIDRINRERLQVIDAYEDYQTSSDFDGTMPKGLQEQILNAFSLDS